MFAKRFYSRSVCHLYVMVLFGIGLPSANAFQGGIGTPDDPYQIATAEQLVSIGSDPNLLDKHFMLIEDIDLDPNRPGGGRVFDQAIIAPVFDERRGSEQPFFTGSFDGRDHAIRSLCILSSARYLGLFGRIGEDGVVSHVHLIGGKVEGNPEISWFYTGALAGQNGGSITGCSSDISVRGTRTVGGLVGGNNFRATITDSHTVGIVSGHELVGGLVGANSGLLLDCHSASQVNGRREVGGLAGHSDNTVSGCYSTGTVNGEYQVGGLVGQVWGYGSSGLTSDSHSVALVTGDEQVGGLVGYSYYGILVNSYSAGSVHGEYKIGGLVGEVFLGLVTHSYGVGSVQGTLRVGGLVGTCNLGTLWSSYAQGWIGGQRDVGGLAGACGGSVVANCYCAGIVSGFESAGGLVGANGSTIANCYSRVSDHLPDRLGPIAGNESKGIVLRSFWDSERFPLAPDQGVGTGLTNSELRDPNTYLDAGWDFLGERANGLNEVWVFPNEGGLPQLAAFADLAPQIPRGSGTLEDPYLIDTAASLGAIWYRPTDLYRLTSDIDLSGVAWSTAPIPYFAGRLEGQGHIIYNLAIDGGNHLGLIGILGSVSAASALSWEDFTMVGGLRLENVNITGRGSKVGALIGVSSGNVRGCFSSGSVSGDYHVGGLIGFNNDGSLSESESTASVKGNSHVGALVGGERTF